MAIWVFNRMTMPASYVVFVYPPHPCPFFDQRKSSGLGNLVEVDLHEHPLRQEYLPACNKILYLKSYTLNKVRPC